MTAVYVVFALVLLLGVVGVVRSMWPTPAERAFGYPHDSAEARMLRGEQ